MDNTKLKADAINDDNRTDDKKQEQRKKLCECSKLLSSMYQTIENVRQDKSDAKTCALEDFDIVARAQHKSDLLRILIGFFVFIAVIWQVVVWILNEFSFNSDNFWNIIMIIIELFILCMYYFHFVCTARHNISLKMPWGECEVYDSIFKKYLRSTAKPYTTYLPWYVNIVVAVAWFLAIIFIFVFLLMHFKGIQLDTLILLCITMLLCLEGVLSAINYIYFILSICHKSKEEIDSIPHDAEYPSHSLLIETLTKNAHFLSVMYLSVSFLYSVMFLICFATNLNKNNSILPELMKTSNINHGVLLLYYSAPVVLGLIPFCITSIIPRHCINDILSVWKEKSLTEKYIDLQNGTGDKEKIIESISKLKGDKIEYRFSTEHALVITTIIANLATLLTFVVPYI